MEIAQNHVHTMRLPFILLSLSLNSTLFARRYSIQQIGNLLDDIYLIKNKTTTTTMKIAYV